MKLRRNQKKNLEKTNGGYKQQKMCPHCWELFDEECFFDHQDHCEFLKKRV